MITNLQMLQLHQMEFSQIITEFFCLLHCFFPLYFVLISFMFYAFNLSALKLLPLLTQSFAILTFGKAAYAFIHTSYPVTLFIHLSLPILRKNLSYLNFELYCSILSSIFALWKFVILFDNQIMFHNHKFSLCINCIIMHLGKSKMFGNFDKKYQTRARSFICYLY